MEDPAVTRFREYLRIKTVQPQPDYDGANAFLQRMATELDLPYQVITVNKEPHREVYLMTWEGTDPSLPSILLNSHTDVVPVFPEFWKHDAFAAHKDEKGDIYARGTQDMKCVGMQYLEAIKKLKKEGKRMLRTIHLTWVPDEEIGGHLGMQQFVEMDAFKNLRIGFALDEGLANPTDAFTVFYGERCCWWVVVKCPGNPGHGSRFIEGTAGQKLRKVINSFMDFRDVQEARLKANPDLRLGDVTTTNLTMLWGGIQQNVVPAELSVGFDIRVSPDVDLKVFEAQIAAWCKEAGDDVTYTFRQKGTCQVLTPTSTDDPWWSAFSTAADTLKMKLELEVFPAATDSRYLRQLGFPALGFSPMNNTPILLHDHNEFLNENVFLRGIDVYYSIIPAVANVPSF